MRRSSQYLVIALLTWCSACGPSADDGVDTSDAKTTLTLIEGGSLLGVARGCAGRLTDIDAFGISQDHPEFLVALHPTLGSPVCVDTFEAIEAALADRPVMADRLWRGYLTGLQDLASTIGPDIADAPTPSTAD